MLEWCLHGEGQCHVGMVFTCGGTVSCWNGVYMRRGHVKEAVASLPLVTCFSAAPLSVLHLEPPMMGARGRGGGAGANTSGQSFSAAKGSGLGLGVAAHYFMKP